jgi:drug/metabolite transporter (DMT)-like permease
MRTLERRAHGGMSRDDEGEGEDEDEAARTTMNNIDWKTIVALFLYVAFGIAGQLVLKNAMREMPPLAAVSGSEIGRFFMYICTTPKVLLGVALLAVNFAMMLALLSWAPLTVVVPSSAISYLLLALLARWMLNEHVPPMRWAGVLLVSLGVALVLLSGDAKHKSESPATADATVSDTRIGELAMEAQ